MPELPEVETVARSLAPLLVGRRIEAFEIHDPQRLNVEEPERVHGRRIADVRRLGKQVLIQLASNGRGRAARPLWLMIHLRMTGRLWWREQPPPAPPRAQPGPLRAVWRLDRGALLFHDTRRFGTIRILDDPVACEPDGIDPLTELTPATLRDAIDGARTPIKPWLMRQDRLVGIGNIYASEALFEARIHPARPAGSLRKPRIERLCAALRAVLRRAIEAGGTTFSDFQNGRGDVGNYQHNLRVYDRAGQPCPRCGRAIERVVQQQRATFYCPRCQRAPRNR